MDDLIRAAAANLDLQLVRIAVALEGGEVGAKRLIDNMARGKAHPGARRFFEEAAAILRVRRLLSDALRPPSRRPRLQRFEVVEGGRAQRLPAAWTPVGVPAITKLEKTSCGNKRRGECLPHERGPQVPAQGRDDGVERSRRIEAQRTRLAR